MNGKTSRNNTKTVRQLYRFLSELAENNNREWFNAHKETYLTLRKQWEDNIARLRQTLIQHQPELIRQPAKDISYRIYRDIRFSNDKTPYKTYFAAAITPYGRKTDRAAFYFELSPLRNEIYTGIWKATPQMVRKLRQAISDNSEEFTEIMEPLIPEYNLAGETLKTAPKGFSTDDPMLPYLRQKQLAIHRHIPQEQILEATDWTEIIAQEYLRLKPFNDFINYSLDEEI